MHQSLAAYVENIRREYATGVTTEHSYRPALKDLLASGADGGQRAETH